MSGGSVNDIVTEAGADASTSPAAGSDDSRPACADAAVASVTSITTPIATDAIARAKGWNTVREADVVMEPPSRTARSP